MLSGLITQGRDKRVQGIVFANTCCIWVLKIIVGYSKIMSSM
jgi:hypothetical protein